MEHGTVIMLMAMIVSHQNHGFDGHNLITIMDMVSMGGFVFLPYQFINSCVLIRNRTSPRPILTYFYKDIYKEMLHGLQCPISV